MFDLAIFQQILGSGADAAIIALLFVMWRFDRRLVRLETLIVNGKKKEPK